MYIEYVPHVKPVKGLNMPFVAGPVFAFVEQIDQNYGHIKESYESFKSFNFLLYFSLQPYTCLIPHSAINSGPNDVLALEILFSTSLSIKV